MKRRKYGCDGGCLMIGNGSFRVHFPNRFGDGDHTVFVMSKEEGHPDNHDWEWLGSIEGDSIHVYRYDCLSEQDLIDNIVLTLKGRYSVYCSKGHTGNILLKEW